MESTFDAVIQLEQSLPLYTHEELARINYADIRYDDFIIAEKLIRSLMYLLTLYELSRAERMWSWLIPISESKSVKPSETSSNGIIHTVRFLSSSKLYSVRKITERSDYQRAKANYLIGKLITSHIGSNPNFLRIYAITDFPVIKDDIWQEDNNRLQTGSVVTQPITWDEDQNLQLTLLTELRKGGISRAFMSHVCQILAAIALLESFEPDNLSLGIITMTDILITRSDIKYINYENIGTVQIEGYIAVIGNYDNASSKVDVVGTIYDIQNPRISLRQTSIEFLRNVVDLLGRSSPIKNQVYKVLTDLISQLISDERVTSVSVLSLLVDKMRDLSIFDGIFTLSPQDPLERLEAPSLRTDAPFLGKEDASADQFIHYRLAYSGIEPPEGTDLYEQFVGKINELVATGHADCVRAAKYIQLNDDPGPGVITLATMAALLRLVRYMKPEILLITELEEFIQRNWAKLSKRMTVQQKERHASLFV